MKTYQAKSSAVPPAWDATSSADRTFHNYNITEVAATADTPAGYAYTVDEYDRSEDNVVIERLAESDARMSSTIDDLLVAILEV